VITPVGITSPLIPKTDESDGLHYTGQKGSIQAQEHAAFSFGLLEWFVFGCLLEVLSLFSKSIFQLLYVLLLYCCTLRMICSTYLLCAVIQIQNTATQAQVLLQYVLLGSLYSLLATYLSVVDRVDKGFSPRRYSYTYSQNDFGGTLVAVVMHCHVSM
jgi:hypothetical protein